MTNMMKTNHAGLKIFGIILIIALALFGCSSPQQQNTEVEIAETEATDTQSTETLTEEVPKLFIYTSVYPVHFFAEQIAGDRAVVKSLIPAGAEPHDFEPTAKDIMELSKADFFVYNGGGFETWIEKIVESVNSDKMVLVDTTANIDLLGNEETGNIDQDHSGHGHDDGHKDEHADHGHDDNNQGAASENHEEEHAHDHGAYDPHVWIDPQLAKQQAEEIKNKLVQFDPEYAAFYEENYKSLAQQLDELDKKYVDLSENITRRDFIVSHAAYGYLAKRYDFNQISISGLNPSSEPSARELQQIIEFARDNQVEYILFENTINTKIANVVKESVGAEALVLHNLEVLTEEEISQGKDYFSIMADNLEVLKQALGYK